MFVVREPNLSVTKLFVISYRTLVQTPVTLDGNWFKFNQLFVTLSAKELPGSFLTDNLKANFFHLLSHQTVRLYKPTITWHVFDKYLLLWRIKPWSLCVPQVVSQSPCSMCAGGIQSPSLPWSFPAWASWLHSLLPLYLSSNYSFTL